MPQRAIDRANAAEKSADNKIHGPKIAYVIDPRFGGGTSAAVAQELRVVSTMATVRVFALSSKMFRGNDVAPVLESALQDLGLRLTWDPASISADIVVLHNPAFLKFQSQLGTRILAKKTFVVTHENFVRPSGAPGFDFASCLAQIDLATVAVEKIIAPISDYNRSTISTALSQTGGMENWTILPDNWFNICEFDLVAPCQQPTDRRGRLSRPGLEKFPSLDDLALCFPDTAQSNVILGADSLMDMAPRPPHWTLVPFQGMSVADFFKQIDFMVYFTSPAWRESFGRVLAEGIAAGKLVISDPATARSFGCGVVGATPSEVTGIIDKFIAAPTAYIEQIEKAQAAMTQYSAQIFARAFAKNVGLQTGVAP